MKKILLAVGIIQMEDYIRDMLKDEFQIVGVTTDKEGIIPSIEHKNPDIIVIRETLVGESNVYNLIHIVRQRFPNVRIVFIAKDRHPGDQALSLLVSRGVYDIICGSKIAVQEIIRLIKNPNTYADVSHFLILESITDEFGDDVKIDFVVKKEEAPEENNSETETKKENIKSDTVMQKVGNVKNTFSNMIKKVEDTVQSVQQKNEALKQERVVKEEKREPVKPSENTPIEDKKEGLVSKFLNVLKQGPTQVQFFKPKIVMFAGTKPGIGTTSIGLNVACSLALEGHKTIFIEMNRKPSLKFIFDLHNEYGIDTSLQSLNNNMKDFTNGIVNLKSYPANEKNIEKFPEKLDVMLFSRNFINNSVDIDPSRIKDLLIELVFQFEYQYIILDTSIDIEDKLFTSSLPFSNKIFLLLTQDIAHIGWARKGFEEIKKINDEIKDKTAFVVNRFNKNVLSRKDTEDLLESDFIVVEEYSKEFMEANMEALPIALGRKKNNYKFLNEISKIIKK